ncbi:MAG: hypothetical protein ACKPGI_00320, partial [Verrucomicrobiota bacterium]
MKNLIELLQAGVVLGDGGYLIELERRGYVDSGSGREKVGTGRGSGQFTPEIAIENPEALRELQGPRRRRASRRAPQGLQGRLPVSRRGQRGRQAPPGLRGRLP